MERFLLISRNLSLNAFLQKIADDAEIRLFDFNFENFPRKFKNYAVIVDFSCLSEVKAKFLSFKKHCAESFAFKETLCLCVEKALFASFGHFKNQCEDYGLKNLLHGTFEDLDFTDKIAGFLKNPPCFCQRSKSPDLKNFNNLKIFPKELTGISSSNIQLRSFFEKYVNSTEPVLISGESGTGKGYFAKLLHKHSARAGKPYREVNMANVPETIAESELMGTVKGAFTGANHHTGYFEQTNGGTLLLDEIACMPVLVQCKLLHLCETKIFYRLGSSVPIKMDSRLLAATNADLEKLVETGRFREDLYFRLKTLQVQLVPLRRRIEDIPFLIEPLLAQKQKILTVDAYRKLSDYHWPGNIRELLACIKRSCLQSDGALLGSCDIIL